MSTFPMPLSSFKQFTCVLVSVRQWRHHGDCVSLVNPKTKRCWFVESTKLSFLPCFSSNTQNGKIKYCQLNKYFFPITIAYFEVTVFSIARLYIPRKWISCNLLIFSAEVSLGAKSAWSWYIVPPVTFITCCRMLYRHA